MKLIFTHSILLIFLFTVSHSSFSQSLSINTDGSRADSTAILDVKSTSKGFLVPRMNKTQRNAIVTPATGLLVFQNAPDSLGFYYYTGSRWTVIKAIIADTTSWSITGNSGLSSNNFLGTIDNVPLILKMKNQKSGLIDSTSGSTALGFKALFSTNGFNNTAIGYKSLLSSNTASYNTAIGNNALRFDTSASYNTAVGYASLTNNNIGTDNTALGDFTLSSNTSGFNNTAIGSTALYYNTSANNNTGVGAYALVYNNVGTGNAATGTYAMNVNTSGNFNSALGSYSLSSNTTGSGNTATGHKSLNTNTIGADNVATGFYALFNNVTGSDNTALGAYSLQNNIGHRNTGVGKLSLPNTTTGSDNTALGYNAGTDSGALYNTVSIGNNGYLNSVQNRVLFGNLFTTSIVGNVSFTTFSDARVKKNINEDVKGLDFITRLRPVTYYRDIHEQTKITGNKETDDFPGKYDIEKIKFSGFLAQDVEKAAKASGYDFSGISVPKKANDLYTLSYESFVVPMVKAIQEQQDIINRQQKLIEELLKRMEKMEKK